MSKRIRRYVRRESCKRKSRRVQQILDEFVDLDRIEDARRLPVLEQKLVSNDEPSPDDLYDQDLSEDVACSLAFPLYLFIDAVTAPLGPQAPGYHFH